MTCIKVNNKEALELLLARDGKTDIALMLDKAGVMDSIQTPITMSLELGKSNNLKDLILANSYADMNLTVNNGEVVGKSLQNLLGLKANPINVSNGALIYANNFNAVRRAVNTLINNAYLKTVTAKERAPLELLEKPLVDKEKERIILSKKRLTTLRTEHHALLKTKSSVKEIKLARGKIVQVEKSIERSQNFIKEIEKFKSFTMVYDKYLKDFNMAADKLSRSHTLTSDEISELQNTTTMWLNISNKKENAIGLDKNVEWQNPKIRAKLSEIADHFGSVQAQLDEVRAKYINTIFDEESEIEIDIDFRKDFNEDDHWTTKKFRGWVRSKNPNIQLIGKLVGKINSESRSAYKDIEHELDIRYEAAKSDSDFDIELFKQNDKDGNEVGNMTDRFSFEYWQDWKAHRDATKDANKKWLANNTIVLDFALMFNDKSDTVPKGMLIDNVSDAEKTRIIREFKILLGEDGYNEYKQVMQEQFDEYIAKRDTAWESVETATEENRSAEIVKFRNLMTFISPFIQSKHAISNKEKDFHGKYIRRNNNLIHRIPRKTNPITNEKLPYYDDSFKKIEASKSMYDFYKYSKSLISDAQVNYNYDVRFSPNALPYLQKNLTQQIFNNNTGVNDKFSLMKDAAKLMWTGTKTDVKQGDIEIKKNFTNIGEVAANIFKYKVIEYELAHNKAPSFDIQQKLLNTSYAEASKNQDLDVVKLLKVLTMNSILYKNRKAQENTINILKAEVMGPIKGEDDKDVAKNIVNSIALMNNSLNKDYYGITTKKLAGNISQFGNNPGILSKEARKRSELLQAKIEQIQESSISHEKQAEQIRKLTKTLSEQYKQVYASEIFRDFLGISRVLGIGYNVVASTTNMMLGQVSNIQRAIQGDHYNLKDLHSAMMYMMSNRKKVTAMADAFGLVGDVAYGFADVSSVKKGTTRLKNLAKWINPYMLQTSTEEFNQSPQMIAITKNHKVTRTVDGKKQHSNLLDIMDDTGKIDESWEDTNGRRGNKMRAEVTETIRKVVAETHGDYTSTIEANNHAGTQALIMYRRWLPEMMARRWALGGTDYMTGEDKTGIYTVTSKKAIDLLRGRNVSKLTEEEKGKLLSVAFGDAAMYTMLKLFGLFSRVIFCEDDPNCKDAPFAAVAAINLAKRLNNEVTFFANGFSIFETINNPIAAGRTLLDAAKLMAVFNTFWNQENKDSYYRSGRHKGELKAKVALIKLTPIVNQVDRLWNYGDEITYEMIFGSTWGKLDEEKSKKSKKFKY